MTNRTSQLSVGLFVITATVIAVVLTFQFGQLEQYFQKSYSVVIHFDYAPGLEVGTPIQQNGITIGSVREVRMDEQRGGILVLVDVKESQKLRKDTQPQMMQSLLGDSTIEFVPGSSNESLTHGDMLKGLPPNDPFEAMTRLENRVNKTMDGFKNTSSEFAETSQEWKKVAQNLNNLMETRQGSLDTVIERAAESLGQLTTTLNSANTTLAKANAIISDPKLQANLQKTFTALPLLVEESRTTLASARNTVESIETSVEKLRKDFKGKTDPIAEGTEEVIAKVNKSLTRLDTILKNAEVVSTMIASKDGSLQKFAKDPDLYRNMNHSAASLTVLLKNLEPILSDLQIFSDKVARHPEVLGVRGAIQSSSGIKEATPSSKQNVTSRPKNRSTDYYPKPGLKSHRHNIQRANYEKKK